MDGRTDGGTDGLRTDGQALLWKFEEASKNTSVEISSHIKTYAILPRLFCLSLFQINFSDVPPPYPKKIKLNLDNLLFDLYFIIPILIARLQFPEMRKEM